MACLFERIQQPGNYSLIDPKDFEGGPNDFSVRNRTFTHLWNLLAGIVGTLRPMALPLHRRDSQFEMKLGLCPKQTGVLDIDHSFVLLCVPFPPLGDEAAPD